MDKHTQKLVGYIAFAICALSIFIAVERYADNAKRVDAANRMLQSSPLGGMMGGMMEQMTGKTKMEAGVPTATTYSLILAFITGAAGVGLLATASGRPSKDKAKEI